MYHQWSPYAGASPSTSSQASCWMSVTPENAIVGTAADTASTSRGCWAMWFISAVAPERRTSSTRRPTTSTRLRSRSSARVAGRLTGRLQRSRRRRRRRRPRGRASPGPHGRARSRGRARRPRSSRSSAPDCRRMRRSRPALYAAAASAVVESGRPSGSRGRATGWCPPTSRPSASRRGSGATWSRTATRELARPGVRISGIAVDSTARRGGREPRVQIGASVEPAESTSRPGVGAQAHAGRAAAGASATPPRGVSRSSKSGSTPEPDVDAASRCS